MIRMCLFTCGSLATPGSLCQPCAIWWGPPLSPHEGPESRASHAGSKPGLHDWASIKTLSIKAEVSSLVGNTVWCCHTSFLTEVNMVQSPLRAAENPCLDLCWALLDMPVHLADCHPHPSSVINCNCECNSFKWVLWVFLVNCQSWGGFGTSALAIGIRGEVDLGTPKLCREWLM